MRKSRQATELADQFRTGMSGLPQSVEPTVRVRHGSGHTLAECQLWVLSMERARVRLCDLPAGVGLTMRMVEQAVKSAGFDFPTTDLGLRASWHRTTHLFADENACFELAIVAPDPQPVPPGRLQARHDGGNTAAASPLALVANRHRRAVRPGG
jgi:hypothetical protein